MSYRDDSSSTFHGGGGYSRNGNPGSNGGVGGGMGGGFGGGGGARNGGFNSSTGLTTGTSFSGKQTGMPGGISEQLAALFRQSQPKVGRPNAARPVTQPPLPTYVEPPPVVEPPLPPYVDEPYGLTPETVPGVPAPPKPSFNPYSAARAYQSAYGPEGYAFAGVPGMGMRRTVNAISNANSQGGFGGGISASFNDKYGKK